MIAAASIILTYSVASFRLMHLPKQGKRDDCMLRIAFCF